MISSTWKSPQRTLALLGAALALAAGAPATAEKQAPARELRYEQMVFAMGGHEVGTTESRDLETAGGYRFERKSELSLKRGATVIEMQTSLVADTRKDLSPVRFTFEKRDAAGTFKLIGVVEGQPGQAATLVLTSEGTGGGVESRVPLPAGTTFSAAADLWVRQNLKAGARFDRSVIIEEMGAIKPMVAEVKAGAKGGFVVEAQLAGLTMTEELDARGRTLVARTPALGAVAYPVGTPPPAEVGEGQVDMLARSTWPAPRLAKEVKKVSYRIWTPDAATFKLPEDERQRVVARTAEYLDVEVTDRPSTRGALDAARARELSSATPYEAIADPSLKRLAEEKTVGARTTREKVERLVRFVYRFVDEKSLDRGYAPAVATLKSRTGDCTEHSVLLSALLRSLGIPTRLVDGVVVDGGRAGYHEWVEVQVDGEGFVPADPTFGEFPASPARLKLAEGSSSPEGLLDLGIAAGRILRPGVKIEVLGASPPPR